MGILFIPPYTSAIQSLVRLPDTGWDTSLPSSVLDLSRSSSLAAVVQVNPTPFITRNTVGAAASATPNTANFKLSEPDPHRQAREEQPNRARNVSRLSPNVNASTVSKRAFHERSDARADGGLNDNSSSLHITSQSEISKPLNSYQTAPREASSAKRFKCNPSVVRTHVPSSVYMITVGNQISGAMVPQNAPQAPALLVNGNGSQQAELGLLRLQREAQELRAVNNQLKQRLINYQNLFKDKQKLRTVINIIYKNQPLKK